MELAMIKQNIEIAEHILEQEKLIYENAKALYKKGELAQASFDKVCERTIQADIALCDALIVASKNGYHPKKES
jgi:mannitol/fructose-specific phosphotransferase system IIA component